MTAIPDIDLERAESDFMVSNTPTFLVRKLQANSGVQRIAREISKDEILAVLGQFASKEPTNLRESVTPYALLVALSMKPDISGLQAAELVSADPSHRWFDYIRRALLQLYRPTARVEMRVPARAIPQLRTPPTTTTSSIQIKVPAQVVEQVGPRSTAASSLTTLRPSNSK